MSRKKPAKRASSRTEQKGSLERMLPTLNEQWRRLGERVRENAMAVGIAIVLFLRPFVSGKTYEWSNGVCQIAIFALFAMWIARACRLKKLTVRAPLMTACLGLFVVVCALTFFTTVDSDQTYRRFFEILSYFLMFVMAASAVRGPRAVVGIIVAVAVSSVLVCGYGFYQGWFGLEEARSYVDQHQELVSKRITGELSPQFMHRLSSNRIFSFFLHPNSFAGYLAMLIPISICSFVATLLISRRTSGATGEGEELPPFSVVAWAVVALVQAAALVWTFSRGAWLSLFISMAGLAVFVLSRGRKLWREAAVVLCLCALVAGSTGIEGGQEQGPAQQPVQDSAGGAAAPDQGGALLGGQVPTVSDLISQATWEARVTYWRGALGMIKERPLLGVGLGAFGSAYPRFKVLGGYTSQEAHNDPLQSLAETGLIGFIALMAFWLLVVRLGFRSCSSEGSISVIWLRLGLLFGIISFFLHSLVDFDFEIPGIALTVCAFCGLLVAASDEPVKTVRFGWLPGMATFAALGGATALSLRPHVADALYHGIGFVVPRMVRDCWKIFPSVRLLVLGVVAALICCIGARLLSARRDRARRAYRACVVAACLAGLVAFLAAPLALLNMSDFTAVIMGHQGFGLSYRSNQLEAAKKVLQGQEVSDLLLVTLFPDKKEREQVKNWRESGADRVALTRRKLKRIKSELTAVVNIYPHEALYNICIGQIDLWLVPFEREPVRAWDNAIAHYEKAVELHPWNHYWRVLLGREYLARGIMPGQRRYMIKALEEFEKAVENYPHDPAVWRHFGAALLQDGQRGRARVCFERAAELEEHVRS
jgi:O-antigen ligase